MAHQISRVRLDDLNMIPFANDDGDDSRRPRYCNGGGGDRVSFDGSGIFNNNGSNSGGGGGGGGGGRSSSTGSGTAGSDVAEDPVLAWFSDMAQSGLMPKTRAQRDELPFDDIPPDETGPRSIVVPGMSHRRLIVERILEETPPKL